MLKSYLAIIMILLALFAMFTMFEIFGRTEKRFNMEKLKKFHKANGIIYILLFGLISYFCLDFIIKTKAEPSSRVTFHGLFALTVIILLFLKVSFVRFYRQYYNKIQTIGILIALMTFGMIGTSAGHYLLITKFGTEKMPKRLAETKKDAEFKIAIKTDPQSIVSGKELYNSKCYFCHAAYSTKWGIGPGHKGILKNPYLPVSKKTATPENVANQIRNPYKDMPSFSYLSEEDVLNLIAYLNTL
jgi:cytochrome c2